MALTKVSGSILKDPLNLGEVSIGGTLTYEDVTNIDSVGVITARSNIDCNGSLDVDGHTNLDNVSIAGVTTITGASGTLLQVNHTAGSGGQGIIRTKASQANSSSFLRAEDSGGTYIGLLKYGTGHSAYGALGAGDGAIYANSGGGNDTNITIMADSSTGYINFATGGNTERVRITSTGQLLVGTTSSDFKLHVDASNKAAEIGIDNSGTYKSALNTTNNANADFNIQHKTNLTSIGTGVNIPLCFHIGGGFAADSAEKMRLDTAGTLHIKGGNIEAGDDSFPLNFLDSISNYIGVAADGGSNNGDALFIAHSHGSGLAVFGYEAGGDRLVIGTDAGGGTNKIDFLTDVGGTSGGNTDNLNGKVPKMRIAANGVITLGSPTNTVLKAEVCNAVSGHQFISQCSDNNNGFEVYQQHGSTTTRNTFATYANTGSGSSKQIQFSVRGDGRLFKGGHQIYPVIQIHQARISGNVSNSTVGSYQDIKNLVTFTPLKSGSMVHVQVICQTWNGSQTDGQSDAYARLQHNNGGSYTTFTECDRVQGNFQFDERYHHNPFIMDGWFTTTTTNSTTIKFQGMQYGSLPTAFNWFHSYGGRITLMEYDIT